MRFRSVISLLLPLITFTALSGCEIINPSEDTPSYLQINTITLDTRKSSTETYGTASNNITDAWVYANGKRLGAFELPAKIPVLAKDSVELSIYAGVYVNGQKGSRVQYSFYNLYKKTVFLEPGKVKTIEPVVKFVPQTVFPFPVYEEFNSLSAQTAMRLYPGSPYKMELNQDSLADLKYANGSVGVVYGKSGNTQPVVLESVFNGKLPYGIKAAFLEFDYRSTMDFEPGFVVSLAGQSVRPIRIRFKPTRQWKRLYLNLTEEVNNAAFRGADFKVEILAYPTGNDRDYFAIDNVRLIHF
jgi:hypothetical protein